MPDNRNIPEGAWAPLGHEPGAADRGHDPTEMSTQSRFETMGTVSSQAVNQSAAPSANTIVRPKGHSKDSTVRETATVRPHTLERNGFQGAPQVAYSYPNDPSASQTFRNVKLMPSAKGNRDFYARRVEGPSLIPEAWPAGAWHAPNKPAGA